MSIRDILILEPTPFTDSVCEILGPAVHISRGPLTRPRLFNVIGSYDAVFARLGHQLDRELLSCGSRLQVIATPATGSTHIDVPFARASGIDVLSLRDEPDFLTQLPATAELTWALLLAVLRNIVPASRHTLSSGWDRDRFWSTELAGKTIGLIGVGRVGRMVARYAHAFGMQVIGHDLKRITADSIHQVEKQTLLETADVISLHAHYSHGDPFILDANDFDSIKPGCILINTSRGELVNEQALIDSIRCGKLRGVGLDVLAGEPPRNEELLQLQETFSVVITPHIGGATLESIMKTEVFMAHKLAEYIARTNNDA